MTDGKSFDVTSNGGSTFSAQNTLVISASKNVFYGRSAGTTTAFGTWNGKSGNASVTVGGKATATSLTLSYPSKTVAGLVGATLHGTATVGFNDSTSFPDANAAALNAGANISDLLSFSSSSTSVGVDNAGTVSLADNSYQPGAITATACGSASVSGFAQMVGNLHPAPGDAKLGSLDGLTFPAAAQNQKLSIPVRIQCPAGASLLAWQISLRFDTAVFSSPSAHDGPDWSGGSYSAPVLASGLLLMAGSNLQSTVTASAQVAMASLTVLTQLNETVQVSAEIVVLTFSNGVTVSNAQLVAGTAYMQINGGGTVVAAPAQATPSARRRLMQSASTVYGDCNVDGKLDANDALTAQKIGLGTLANPHLEACEPTLRGLLAVDSGPSVLDARYLLFMAVQQFLYLPLTNASQLVLASDPGNAATLSASFVDPSGNAANCSLDTVVFEVHCDGLAAQTLPALCAGGNFTVRPAIPRTGSCSASLGFHSNRDASNPSGHGTSFYGLSGAIGKFYPIVAWNASVLFPAVAATIALELAAVAPGASAQTADLRSAQAAIAAALNVSQSDLSFSTQPSVNGQMLLVVTGTTMAGAAAVLSAQSDSFVATAALALQNTSVALAQGSPVQSPPAPGPGPAPPPLALWKVYLIVGAVGAAVLGVAATSIAISSRRKRQMRAVILPDDFVPGAGRLSL